jgi:hypothetical protein
MIGYTLCVLVVAATMWLALRLSHPPDPYAHQVRSLGPAGATTQVETNNDLLQVKVGKDTYRYRLLRTEKGLVAAEEPTDKK